MTDPTPTIEIEICSLLGDASAVAEIVRLLTESGIPMTVTQHTEVLDACRAYRSYGPGFCHHEPKCWLPREAHFPRGNTITDPNTGWWGEPKP